MSAEEFFGLDDNDCTAEKYPITYEEILSSLVSNADDGENDNNVSEATIRLSGSLFKSPF